MVPIFNLPAALIGPSRVGVSRIAGVPWLAVAAAVGLLGACGGGSAPTGNGGPVISVAAEVPELVTMPEYLVLRNSADKVKVDGGPTPDAAGLATLAAANRQMAAEQVVAQLSGLENSAFAPPLTYLLVRTLAAASAGATLIEIQSKFDTLPSATVAALQTGRVHSEWWSDQGRRFRTTFMATVDQLGPTQRLATWSGAEAGFASGSSATLAPLSGYAFADPRAQLRMAARHRLVTSMPLTAATSFTGVFDRATSANPANDLVDAPLVRVTQGIKRHHGTGFTADIGQSGGLTWVMITPVSGALTDFGSTSLRSALDDVVSVLPTVAGMPAGAWVMPAGSISLRAAPEQPLLNAGVNLPFDKVNANLKNLDNLGGTHAVMSPAAATWNASTSALSLETSQIINFLFSPQNVHGSGGSETTMGNSTTCSGTLQWPVSDARSFFMAAIDAQGWVVHIVGVQAPPGSTPTTPTCVPS